LVLQVLQTLVAVAVAAMLMAMVAIGLVAQVVLALSLFDIQRVLHRPQVQPAHLQSQLLVAIEFTLGPRLVRLHFEA
jgi:hypothetical protein